MHKSIPHPKRLAALIGLGALIAAAGLELAGHLLVQQGFVTILLHEHLTTTEKPITTTTPKVVIPEADHTRPLAVMIDNHPDALPQSGIDKASAVYESPVEGSITRLMAVFRKGDVPLIGPVRSARPYFLDWAAGLDAVYGHFGGSDEALKDLRATKRLSDVDGMTAGSTFWRDDSRLAPHNAYTSTTAMRAFVTKQSWAGETDDIDSNLYDTVEPNGTAVASFTVVHDAGGDATNWKWNASVQAWLRSVRGKDSVTRDGKKLLPKTVVVIETKKKAINDPQRKGLIGVETVGTGKATVLRDGVAITGVWKKQSTTSPVEVFDASGKKIPFAMGQVWYEIITANAGGTLDLQSK